MVRALLLNFCVLITLTYLLTLTYRRWPEIENRTLTLQRLGFESFMPLALLMSPAMISPGILADLRVVPLALTTLRYGPQAGLMVMIPVLIYRVYLGGAGVGSTFFSVLGVIALMSLFRPHLRLHDPKFSWRKAWPWVFLIFLPNTLLLPIVSHQPDLFVKMYLPVLLLDVLGFMIAHSMLLSRMRLLQLTSNLRLQANHDALTGLRNRRQFDTDYQAAQAGTALLLLDIDHFKKINDQYGHQVGDLVLKRVGKALSTYLRSTDLAYRYGGEEFAVLIHSPQPPDLPTIAERLRQRLASVTFPELSQGHITVSIGAAFIDPDHPQSAQLQDTQNTQSTQNTLQRADEALYAAKHAGRNCVRVWPLLPES